MPFPDRAVYATLGDGDDLTGQITPPIQDSRHRAHFSSNHDRTFSTESNISAPSQARIEIHSSQQPFASHNNPPPVPSLSFTTDTSYNSRVYAADNTYDDAPTSGPSPGLNNGFTRYVDESDTQRLFGQYGPRHSPSMHTTRSARSRYEDAFQPAQACPSHKGFYLGRFNWLSITVFILALFSTVFSGIFLAIAMAAPSWRRVVHTGGSLTASSASIMTTAFAKAIELSFVAVFVTFLGQVLSRRAISREGKGMTLAEMSMRGWIMQPGTMITHYQTLRYAAFSFLGLLAITVAIMAMLYTTAAQALVTPALRFSEWQQRPLYGAVQAAFANPEYLADTCKTPITKLMDPVYEGSTCLAISHAAQGFHNYQQYLAAWATYLDRNNLSTELGARPKGVGLLYENTTINGSWIHKIDMKSISTQHSRIINNVTLAFPHAGVFAAARNPLSDIEQPEDLDGLGSYNLKAAVPSPYLNVLCANAKKSELKAMVYKPANNTNTTDQPTAWLDKVDWGKLARTKTPLDDVFGGEYGWPTQFYKYPNDYNTILNNTGQWPKASIYLLGKGGPDQQPADSSPTDPEYFICRLRGGLTPNCSTIYAAASAGGQLSTHCEDANDPFSYLKGGGNSSRVETISADWFNVATVVLNSLSLNNGVIDGSAANARLLTQLQLTDKKNWTLNASLPSPAEALSVMAGCGLVMSSINTPFVEYWNYTGPPRLDFPGNETAIQSFNASIQAQSYASGGTQAYQKGFYIVLAFVFAINVFVLVYFVFNRGLVTDFSEPPNLFSIAVNSPPNELLAGSCGGGPRGQQYRVAWKVEHENDHLFIAGDLPLDEKAESGAFTSGSRGMNDDGKGAFLSVRQRSTSRGDLVENEHELGAIDRSASQLSIPMSSRSPSLIQGNRAPDGMVGRMYSKISKRRSFL